MTLPLPPTLESLRNSVSIRVGLAASGNLSARMQPILTELIRQAQAEIYHRCSWARLWRTTDISLVSGQRDYDIPADSFIGTIGPVWCINDENRPFPVEYDDTLEVEWSTPATAGLESGRPLWWKVLNDLLRIAPAPDATVYPTLQLHYQQASGVLTSNESRASVDGEAIIQLATIRMKEYMGVGGPQMGEVARFERYLYDLRATVAPQRSYGIATRTIDGPAYWTSPSADTYTTPWISGWNPPGAGW